MEANELKRLKNMARSIRRSALTMNAGAGMGHTGADLSEADILTVLYGKILHITSDTANSPDRDRFLLSKGHGVAGLYATLAEFGFIPREWLGTYLSFESHLPGHPVRGKTPGIELCTGGLGHGLAVGVGLSLAAKLSGRTYRTFVLCGDGELQEGSNWEALMSGARFELDNLTLIVDRNRLQLGDRTESIVGLEPLSDKLSSFGWRVVECDGHDMVALSDTLATCARTPGKPHALIARTIKGRGVSFIEDQAAWHHKVPTAAELTLALSELAEEPA